MDYAVNPAPNFSLQMRKLSYQFSFSEKLLYLIARKKTRDFFPINFFCLVIAEHLQLLGTPMFTLINYEIGWLTSECPVNGLHLFFVTFAHVSVLLFRNYSTICFTTFGNVKSKKSLLNGRKQLFLWVGYTTKFIPSSKGWSQNTKPQRNKKTPEGKKVFTPTHNEKKRLM